MADASLQTLARRRRNGACQNSEIARNSLFRNVSQFFISLSTTPAAARTQGYHGDWHDQFEGGAWLLPTLPLRRRPWSCPTKSDAEK